MAGNASVTNQRGFGDGEGNSGRGFRSNARGWLFLRVMLFSGQLSVPVICTLERLQLPRWTKDSEGLARVE